jgi:hypothetical protein
MGRFEDCIGAEGCEATGVVDVLGVLRVEADGVFKPPGRMSLGIEGSGRRSSV